jgi:hypothetical protein
MARLKSGIIGPISGKVGTVIGSTWKGQPYLKAAHKPRTKRISQKELANRRKFAMAQEWLRPLTKFVREGFKGYTETVEGFVAAKSWLLKNSFEGEGADLRINPALVKLSHGDLPLSADIIASVNDDMYLQFTWDPSRVEGGSPMDQVMLMAYNIKRGFGYRVLYGQFRSAGSDGFSLGPAKGETFHLYLAFMAEDRSRQSDSVYLGAISL